MVLCVPLVGTVATSDWYDPYQCLVRWPAMRICKSRGCRSWRSLSAFLRQQPFVSLLAASCLGDGLSFRRWKKAGYPI
ncbi:MAG: hypothetical protein SPI30_01525 [Prevotella sp.]|nr:hypothetical protein [Prevotella sp.]